MCPWCVRQVCLYKRLLRYLGLRRLLSLGVMAMMVGAVLIPLSDVMLRWLHVDFFLKKDWLMFCM